MPKKKLPKLPEPVVVQPKAGGPHCVVCGTPFFAEYAEQCLEATHASGRRRPSRDTVYHEVVRALAAAGFDKATFPSLGGFRAHITIRGCSKAWNLWDE